MLLVADREQRPARVLGMRGGSVVILAPVPLPPWQGPSQAGAAFGVATIAIIGVRWSRGVVV